MRKYILIISCFTFFCLFAKSQEFSESKEIRNLKGKLAGLANTSKVDCLNRIAKECKYLTLSKVSDSMLHYVKEAGNLAEQLNYKKGLATSSTYMGLYELITRKNNESVEKHFLNAEKIGKEIKNDSVLGWNYLVWSEMFVPARKNIPKRDSIYLDLLKKAYFHSQRAGDEECEVEAATWLCNIYLGLGKPDEAFPYNKRTVALSHVWSTREMDWKQVFGTMAFANMSSIFEAAGDYETAMEYLLKGREYDKKYNTFWDMTGDIGMLYYNMKQADSALYYIKKAYESEATKRPRGKISLGMAYLLNKNYNLALPLLQSAVDSLRVAQREVRLPLGFIELAKAYEGMKNYKTSLKYAKEGYTLAKLREKGDLILEGSEMLSRLYHQLGKNDSAYFYLSQFTVLKDSVNNKQNQWKLNIKLSEYKKEAEDTKKEARLGFLNRDNKIKEQQLKQETTFKYFLIAAFLALVFASLYVFRNLTLKRKNELQKQKLESEKKQVELEMQALRAQMNPHFIFNCLSSINRFILKNETKVASNYLTRFSRLMRMVLNNSQKTLISLDDELEMLEIYLEMERLRFKNSFDYAITFLNTVDSDNVFIPPLLLQPFCENAIWHGLMNKEGQGRLDIELSMSPRAPLEENYILNCVITDNGVGREKAEEMKSKTAENEKSMGLKITTERLTLLNREKGLQTFFEIEDLKDENGFAIGTKVNLKISFKDNVEELV